MTAQQEKGRRRKIVDDGRLTERTLINHALEFAASADAVAERFGEAAPFFTQLFLIGRSLELALKSFLRKTGATKAELQNWGHDLETLLAKSEVRGFPVRMSVDDRQIIGFLNGLYVSKRLEYQEIGSVTTPLTGPARRLLDQVLKGVFQYVVGLEMLVKRMQVTRPTACDLGLRISPAARYLETTAKRRPA